MFPLRDDNPTLRKSIATFIIIALTSLAWIIVQGMGTSPALMRSVCAFGLVPGELLHKNSAGHPHSAQPNVLMRHRPPELVLPHFAYVHARRLVPYHR